MTGFRTAAAVAVLVPLLALAGCTSTHPQVRPSASHAQRAPQLTIAGARRAFDAFLPRFIRLAADFSPGEARSLTTGAELPAQLFFQGQSGPAITRLTGEVFYVPRLTSYPRWFLAAGQQGGSSAAGRLFVMVQTARSAPWRTAMALYDIDSAAGMLHQLATTVTRDAQGYAEVVSPDDPALDVPPSAISATYASYLDGHASQVTQLLFEDGPNTSGYIAEDQEIARGAGRYGWRDTDHQTPASLPVYALRISTGGAIVIFATYDTASWTAESSAASLPVQPSGAEVDYVPPSFVVQDLGATSPRAGLRLSATAVDLVLAFVQPKGVGFVDALINNGAAIGVHESGAP
jgi:hypothetical protein